MRVGVHAVYWVLGPLRVRSGVLAVLLLMIETLHHLKNQNPRNNGSVSIGAHAGFISTAV